MTFYKYFHSNNFLGDAQTQRRYGVYGYNAIDDVEHAFLYNACKPKNPDIPYFVHDYFYPDRMTDDEFKTEFRFFRNDIYNLMDVRLVTVELTSYNGLKVDAVEAMCIFLKLLIRVGTQT